MTTATRCPVCNSQTADQESASLPDWAFASGNIIYVSGISYAALESMIRPVFSEMPSNFASTAGVCYLQYKSSPSHDHDFTLVVTGVDNDAAVPLLTDHLLPRATNLVAFGPLTREESNLFGGSSVQMPRNTVRISHVGIEDWDEYYEGAMKTALISVSSKSTL